MTVVVGDVNDDVVVRHRRPVTPDSDTPSVISRSPGGSAANQAAWLAHLGVPVRLAARVGAADAGRLGDELAAVGVDARLGADPVEPTGTVVVVVGPAGRRDMYTSRGANAALGAAELGPALLDGAGHLHLSGYCLVAPGSRDAVGALVAEAARRSVPVSVDPGSAAELRSWPGGPADLLAPVGRPAVLLPNLDEARLLAGAHDPDAVVGILAQRCGVVAVTLGAAGVTVGCGSRRWSLPADPAVVVDPTGAGDAFTAGFLAAWRGGAPPQRCAVAGLAAAAVAVGGVGARPPVDSDDKGRAAR